MSTPEDSSNPDQPPHSTAIITQTSRSQEQTLSSRSQAQALECSSGDSGLREGMAGAMQESAPRLEPGNEGKCWEKAKFEDVILLITNGLGGNQNKNGIGLPLSRIETIADQTINYERIGFLAEFDPIKSERYKLKKGDILFSHINSPIHLGKTAIFHDVRPLYHGVNLLRISVNTRIVTPEFFNYYCNYLRTQGEFAIRAQHAVNQSSLNQKKLKEFEIILPPLAEQKQIADRLDALLAQVDTLKIRLDAIPAILKRFRQSVLAAAVSGKLTEGWRNGNDYLSINTQFSDIVKYSQVGIVKSSKDQSFHNAVPYFKMNNIGNMGKMTKEDMINVDVTDEELSKFKLLEGDFLFNTRNSYELVGKTCVYKSIKSEAVYNNNILRIRFKHNVSNSRQTFKSLIMKTSGS